MLVPIAGICLNLYLIYAAFFSALWAAPFRTGKSVVVICLALFALLLMSATCMRRFRRDLRQAPLRLVLTQLRAPEGCGAGWTESPIRATSLHTAGQSQWLIEQGTCSYQRPGDGENEWLLPESEFYLANGSSWPDPAVGLTGSRIRNEGCPSGRSKQGPPPAEISEARPRYQIKFILKNKIGNRINSCESCRNARSALLPRSTSNPRPLTRLSKTLHLGLRRHAECQPYVSSVLCPTSIIYPSGSRM